MIQETPRLLHVFSTLDPGGPQVRFADTVNALGDEFKHLVIAMDGRYGVLARIRPGLSVEELAFPSRHTPTAPFVFRSFLRRLRPDLLLSYNWGAIEAVLGGILAGVCPVIHTEDGFGPDEAVRLKTRRVAARGVLLNLIHRTVVPSRTLLRIASDRYLIRPGKVQLIVNGIDTARFQPGPGEEVRRRFGIGSHELVFLYVGHLRREKNLPLMVRAFLEARPANSKLILVGDGACRAELESIVKERDSAGRVILAGAASDPLPFYRAAGVFLLSSTTEQMPLALLEAMACGLPALCTNVGDIAEMLDTAGSPELVASDDLIAYVAALGTLAGDPQLRARLGRKNRDRCLALYSQDKMISRYGDLYRGALRTKSSTP
jgi:glycosyltransferase involved in cell wall biosynthesis